jgi:ArsR family transcriptional regulator, arsenate/arsenite/antimonite-responsive transcriptional repressor / arsenate reductase (thioredoxin)
LMKAEYGIDLSRHAPKHFDRYAKQDFDCVITLCDRVREVCPNFPGGEAIHWSIANPATGGPDADTYPLFQQTAAELETRIDFLLASLGERARRRRRKS